MKTKKGSSGFLNLSSLLGGVLAIIGKPGNDLAEGIEEAQGLMLSPLRIPQLFELLKDKRLHLSGWAKDDMTIVEITAARRDDDDNRTYFSTRQVMQLLQTTCIVKDETIGEGEYRLTFKKQL